MLTAAFFIMLEISFYGKVSKEIINNHFIPFLFVFLIWLFVFFLFNLYETQSIKPTIPNLRIISIASIVALTASITLFYIISSFGIAPKTNLIIFSVAFLLLFIFWRRIFYNIFSIYFRKGVSFIVEQNKDSDSVHDIKNYIQTYPQSGFFILGIYSSLEEYIKRQDKTIVDTLVISKNSFKKTKDLILIYRTVKNVLDLTYAYENILGKIPVDSIDETWFLHNVQSTNTTFRNIINYFIDKTVAFIVLVITFPLLLIVALLIKLNDRGSVFYTQSRVGKDGNTFKLYKFRSMIVNSELNGAVWTGKNDDRITRIGKIIRKLHIDEIPQMINILKGDLSFVGPRPERPEFVTQLEKTIPHYELRHIIRPGFTGWAQIKYRYANTVEDSKEKFEYDLYYKNRNLFLDFGIILRTIQIIFTH
jgi:exopolysaccharide biosynthesis polyprenyl glycosylphosphotransferase